MAEPRIASVLQHVRQPAITNLKDKVASELQDFGDVLGRKTSQPPVATNEDMR